MMPSRDPKLLTPMLQEFWPLLKKAYESTYPGRFLFLSCTHRSVEEQKKLYAKNRPGAIVTKCDGAEKLSNHNYLPARAFDVFIAIDGKAVWEPAYYSVLGPTIKELGYEGRVGWGGWFRGRFHDYPHLEQILF